MANHVAYVAHFVHDIDGRRRTVHLHDDLGGRRFRIRLSFDRRCNHRYLLQYLRRKLFGHVALPRKKTTNEQVIKRATPPPTGVGFPKN